MDPRLVQVVSGVNLHELVSDTNGFSAAYVRVGRYWRDRFIRQLWRALEAAAVVHNTSHCWLLIKSSEGIKNDRNVYDLLQ